MWFDLWIVFAFAGAGVLVAAVRSRRARAAPTSGAPEVAPARAPEDLPESAPAGSYGEAVELAAAALVAAAVLVAAWLVLPWALRLGASVRAPAAGAAEHAAAVRAWVAGAGSIAVLGAALVVLAGRARAGLRSTPPADRERRGDSCAGGGGR
jgi:hypothetical protein